MKHLHSLLALSLSVTACGSASRQGAYVYTTSAAESSSGHSAPGVRAQYGQSNTPVAPSSPVAPSRDYGGTTTLAERGPQYDGDGISSSPGETVEVHPDARPGLATEWGETRHSSVSFTPFVRASSSPIDLATIHYNDAHLAAMQSIQHNARPASWVGIRHDGVRLSLRDESDNALPGYFAGDTVYVLGNAGQRYTILLENTTPYRFESVVSVDGLDVINGQPASGSHRGYILPAYGRVEIEGFRQNQNAVATFRFGSVGNSYAAQTGDARNVGVIGVALYAENGAPMDMEQNEIQLREQANPFPGGFARPPQTRRYYY
jgi:hypothetical protein